MAAMISSSSSSSLQSKHFLAPYPSTTTAQHQGSVYNAFHTGHGPQHHNYNHSQQQHQHKSHSQPRPGFEAFGHGHNHARTSAASSTSSWRTRAPPSISVVEPTPAPQSQAPDVDRRTNTNTKRVRTKRVASGNQSRGHSRSPSTVSSSSAEESVGSWRSISPSGVSPSLKVSPSPVRAASPVLSSTSTSTSHPFVYSPADLLFLSQSPLVGLSPQSQDIVNDLVQNHTYRRGRGRGKGKTTAASAGEKKVQNGEVVVEIVEIEGESTSSSVVTSEAEEGSECA